MPAQPASSMKWNGNYVFGNEVLVNMADHGGIVAAVIAGWSITETHMGRTFASLIGAKQPVAMRMYGAARSFEIQRDLFQAAVDEILPKRYATLFRAALIVMNRAAQHRHRFAHGVWGASSDPELVALFLVEPQHFWNLATRQIKYWRSRQIEKVGPVEFAAGTPKLQPEHIFVYCLSDLQEARHEIERAYRIADALRQFVDVKSPARRRAIYKWLSNSTDIRLALKKAKSNPQPKKSSPRVRRHKAGEKLSGRA